MQRALPARRAAYGGAATPEFYSQRSCWEPRGFGLPGSARRADSCPTSAAGTGDGMTGSGLVQRAVAGFVRARRRVGWLDHVVRAGMRYAQADGGRLAAAVTYYAG